MGRRLSDVDQYGGEELVIFGNKLKSGENARPFSYRNEFARVKGCTGCQWVVQVLRALFNFAISIILW